MPGKSPVPTAIHAKGQSSDGSSFDIVAFGNFKVLVTFEDGAYIAQGLDIDLVAQADTLEDVQRRFESDLRDTIAEYLEVYQSIEALLLQRAPQDVFEQYARLAGKAFELSQADLYRRRLVRTEHGTTMLEHQIDYFQVPRYANA